MRLYRTRQGIVAEDEGKAGLLKDKDWDALFNRKGLAAYLAKALKGAKPLKFDPARAALLAPIGTQEVWAAGVTYFRSRDARMEESKAAGGGDFYDRVYDADRPELFFKATPHRVVGPGAAGPHPRATRSGTSPSRSCPGRQLRRRRSSATRSATT